MFCLFSFFLTASSMEIKYQRFYTGKQHVLSIQTYILYFNFFFALQRRNLWFATIYGKCVICVNKLGRFCFFNLSCIKLNKYFYLTLHEYNKKKKTFVNGKNSAFLSLSPFKSHIMFPPYKFPRNYFFYKRCINVNQKAIVS